MTVQHLKKVVPVCFALGAGIELFMIKTGFYDIVTRKEADRRVERLLEDERRALRLKALDIHFGDSDSVAEGSKKGTHK